MSFKATIYKVGINPCVEVPPSVTKKMKPVKGYIPVTGTINGHSFKQTLCPIKNAPYRLYVNYLMLKGGKTELGDTATFSLTQDLSVKKTTDYPMHPKLKKELTSNKLTQSFDALTPHRKKEVLKYLNMVKTEETLERNIDKVIRQLQASIKDVRIPRPDF